MRVIKKFEMRRLKHGCGVVAQNFLLNFSLFKITLNPSKKVEFSLENQKDMSVDGTCKLIFMHFILFQSPSQNSHLDCQL